MEAKEYLERLRTIEQEIRTKQETLDVLKAQSEKCTAVFSDMPMGAHDNHSREKTYVRKVMVEQELAARMIELRRHKEEAIILIEKIPDPIIRILLTERYVNGKRWGRVMKIIKSSEQNAHRLHRIGLALVNELLGGAR